MEMKSRLKSRKKRKSLEVVGLNMEEIATGCLRRQVEYSSDDGSMEHDSRFFDFEDKNAAENVGYGDSDELHISLECLSSIYTKFLSDTAFIKSINNSGVDHRRKKNETLDLQVGKNWWTGKSDLSQKLPFKQILEKDVGFNCLPPSFVAGELAHKKRREKIRAAKIRINDIMQPPDELSGGKNDRYFVEHLRAREQIMQEINGGGINWEDYVIEILLLHQVGEDEIEQGHYKRLLDFHGFDSEYL